MRPQRPSNHAGSAQPGIVRQCSVVFVLGRAPTSLSTYAASGMSTPPMIHRGTWQCSSTRTCIARCHPPSSSSARSRWGSTMYQRRAAVSGLDEYALADGCALARLQRYRSPLGSRHLSVLDHSKPGGGQLLGACLADAGEKAWPLHLSGCLHCDDFRLSPALAPAVLALVSRAGAPGKGEHRNCGSRAADVLVIFMRAPSECVSRSFQRMWSVCSCLWRSS